MKKVLILTVVLMSWLFLAADMDITGTWIGETEVPDFPDPDRVTLIIKNVDGEYEGVITDSAGMAEEAVCRDIELDGNKLTMNFDIVNPGGMYVRINATLTIEGAIMKGYWESEDGNMNSLELKRQ